MNAAPILLSIPEYDYEVIELYIRTTHAKRKPRKKAKANPKRLKRRTAMRYKS
jgi:hypothetical protein